jgi:hypothetical protein
MTTAAGIRIKEPATVREGWGFIPTSAPLSWTLAWLHTMMPRVLRGGSIISPYLIPNRRHIAYMVASDTGFQVPDEGAG